MEQKLQAANLAVILIAVILSFFVLKTAQIVFVPLTFTLLAVTLVMPFSEWLDRRFKGRFSWLNVALSLSVIVSVLSLFLWAIWISATVIAEKAPQYTEKFFVYWDELGTLARRYNLPFFGEGLKAEQIGQGILDILAGVLASLSSLMGILVLIFFLVLLFLLEKNSWKNKMRAASKDAERMINVINSVSRRIRRFFLIRTITSVVEGFIVAAFMAAMGVDFAVVWGILSFLFNYIPYIGAFIVTIPATLVAILQLGILKGLIVLGGLTAINQVLGNYVEPMFEGKTIEMSPFLILLSLVFWSWVWGISGTLLAVPIMIAAAGVFEIVPSLNIFAFMLEEKKGHRRAGSAKDEKTGNGD